MNDISSQLQQLPSLGRPELIKLWQELFDRPPLKGMRREVMVPVLAYRIQEKAYGGLDEATEKYLAKVANDLDHERRPVSPLSEKLKVGTRLLREWKGSKHEVRVVAEGFVYQGKNFKSLSSIARLITGARWSGPLFFGLRTGRQ